MVGGAILASLSGCALLPATPAPAPIAPPSGELLPGQEAALALRATLDAAIRTATPTGHAGMLAWALSVSDDQLTALSLPRPAAPSTSSDPTSPPVPDVGAALDVAAAAFAAQAAASTAARPLIWAAMAAWADALANAWALPTTPLEPARTLLTPAAQTETEAVQAAQDAAHEAVYGLEVAAGAPGLTPDDLTQLRQQRVTWLTLRDALDLATPAPTPASPWYQVSRPTDADAGRALAAKLHTDALPVLGRAYAFAPLTLHPALAAQLRASATALPQLGGLMQRWPGLPLT